jgi:DNA-binding XRE family transcriptional regulator
MESTKIDVKAIRKELELNQEQFALKIGVDRRTVINYEKGSVIPESRIKYFTLLLKEKRNQNNVPVESNHSKEHSANDEIKALKEHIVTLKEFLETYKSENKLLKEKVALLEVNVGG